MPAGSWVGQNGFRDQIKKILKSYLESSSIRFMLAQSVLDGLDSAVDPCEDFYSFACGNWIRNHPVPPTENHWNQFEILEKRLDVQVRELLEEENLEEDPQIVKTVRKVYKACMNTGEEPGKVRFYRDLPDKSDICRSNLNN